MLCLDETMKNSPSWRHVNIRAGAAPTVLGSYLIRFSFKMIALVTFSQAVCQLDITILPPLLTFLLGFIYFKTPFHTPLTLTRHYTALREGLGDRIVTDTTFFTVEIQNIVNRRVYERGRV